MSVALTTMEVKATSVEDTRDVSAPSSLLLLLLLLLLPPLPTLLGLLTPPLPPLLPSYTNTLLLPNPNCTGMQRNGELTTAEMVHNIRTGRGRAGAHQHRQQGLQQGEPIGQ